MDACWDARVEINYTHTAQQNVYTRPQAQLSLCFVLGRDVQGLLPILTGPLLLGRYYCLRAMGWDQARPGSMEEEDAWVYKAILCKEHVHGVYH